METALKVLYQSLEMIKSETISLQSRIDAQIKNVTDNQEIIQNYLHQAAEIEIAIKLLEKKNGRKN